MAFAKPLQQSKTVKLNVERAIRMLNDLGSVVLLTLRCIPEGNDWRIYRGKRSAGFLRGGSLGNYHVGSTEVRTVRSLLAVKASE